MKKKYVIFSSCIMMIFWFLASNCFAQTDLQEKYINMEKRILELEEKIREYDQILAPIKNELLVKKRREVQRKKFNQRILIDQNNFSEKEFSKIERLYQNALKKPKSKEAIKNLNIIIKKYPQANRAGCAILTFAKWAEKEQREYYLHHAIERHADCFFEDGVQVGSYALYMLAYVHQQKKQYDKTMELVETLKTTYPDAIDHQGRLLVELATGE